MKLINKIFSSLCILFAMFVGVCTFNSINSNKVEAISFEYDEAINLNAIDLNYGEEFDSSKISFTTTAQADELEICGAFLYSTGSSTANVTTITKGGNYDLYVVITSNEMGVYTFPNDYASTYAQSKLGNITCSLAVGCDDYSSNSISFNYSGNSLCDYLVLKFSLTLGYTVEYDMNSGTDPIFDSPAEDSTLYLVGQSVSLPTKTPIRAGYKFLGWELGTNGSGKIPSPFMFTSSNVASNKVTVIATWNAKFTPDISTLPTAKTDLVYTGNPIALVNGGTTSTNGDVYYALGTISEATSEYSTTIPTATNAGTYYVWYKVIETDDYQASTPACVSVTIAKQKVALPTNKQNVRYTGSLVDGIDLPDGYTTYYSITNNKALTPGDYSAIATLSDTTNYQWDDEDFKDDNCVTIGYTIKKKIIDINWGTSEFVYDGQPKLTTATYKDVNNIEKSLSISYDNTMLYPNTYTATASLFAFEKNNYELPEDPTKQIKVIYQYGTKGTDGYIEFDKTLDSSFTGGILSTGNYYIASDITLTENVWIGLPYNGEQDVTVKLYLDGHIINLNGDNQIMTLGNLYIYNTNTTATHKFSVDNTTKSAVLDEDGSYVVNGGVITGFNASSVKGIISRYSNENTVYSVIPYQQLYIENVSIIGNKIDIEDSTLTSKYICGLIEIDNATFKNVDVVYNIVHMNFTGKDVYVLVDGALLDCGTYKLNNCNFNNNFVKFEKCTYCYGVLVEGRHSNKENSSIDCNYSNNIIYVGDTYNGLVYSAQPLVSSNNKFLDNTISAKGYYGGILSGNYELTLTSATIKNNTFNSIGNNVSLGGIIYLNVDGNNSSKIKDTVITLNTFALTQDMQGTIVYGQKCDYENVEISYNTITNTGTESAYLIRGGLLYCSKVTTTKDCVFTYNTITSSTTIAYPNMNTEGGVIYCCALYTSTNDKFTYNTLTGERFSGGILRVLANSTIDNALFDHNTITQNKSEFLSGGIIECVSSNEDYLQVKNTTIQYNSISNINIINGGLINANKVDFKTCKILYNTILNPVETNSSCDGIIINAGSVHIDNLVVDHNTITQTVDYTNTDNYGMIRGSIAISGDYTIDNLVITNNIVTASQLNGGLLYSNANGTIINLEISNNTLTANKVSNGCSGIDGGIICYWGNTALTLEDSTIKNNTLTGHANISGAIIASYRGLHLDNVDILNNTITNDSGDYKHSIIGTILYITQEFIVDDVNINSNTITCNSVTEAKGCIIHIVGNSQEITLDTLNIYSNTISLSIKPRTSADADIVYYGYGLIFNDTLYDASQTLSYKNVKIYENNITNDLDLNVGLVRIYGGDFENVEIRDNVVTNTSSTFNEIESNAGLYLNRRDVSIKGKVIIYNNLLNSKISNIKLSTDYYTSTNPKLVVSDSSLIDNTSRMTFTYQQHNKNTHYVVVDGGKELFDLGIFEVENYCYYISVDNDNNKIYYNGRVDEEPTNTNSYKFVLNTTRYNGTYSYQWYRFVSGNKILLEGQTSLTLDISHIVFGKYYCVATLKNGDINDGTIESNIASIYPSIVTNPSENNQYKFEVDQDRCKESNTSITYAWNKVIKSDTKLDYIDDTLAPESSIIDSETIDEFFEGAMHETATYSTEDNVWNLASDSVFFRLISFKANDIISISGYGEDATVLGCCIFDTELEMVSYAVAGLSHSYKFIEDGDYYVVFYLSDSDENSVAGTVSMGLMKETEDVDITTFTELTDEDITFINSEIGNISSYLTDLEALDNGKYKFTTATAFRVVLDKNQTIYFDFGNDEGETNMFYQLVAFFQNGDSYALGSYGLMSSQFAFTAFETQEYGILLLLGGEGEETLEIKGVGGSESNPYNNTRGNKLIGDEDGYYNCVATYNDGVETYSITSALAYYEVNKDVISSGEISKKDVNEEVKTNTNDKVEIISGSVGTNVVVVIQKDLSETIKQINKNIKKAVSKKSELIAKFEIHLEDDNGIKVENIDGNTYRVTLTIPTELRNRTNYAIICINDDGSITKYDSSTANNEITFTTTHFSSWAIVADEEKTTSPAIVILFIILAILVLAVILFIIWKIEYDNAYNTDTLKDRKLKLFDIVFLPINNLLFDRE